MKRTLRHPFGGSRHYLRPERERRVKRKAPRQPHIHQGRRLSIGAVLDAPDTSSSRPTLRLRIVGLCVIALFALLGLRLWTLQVIQAPAAAKAVTANQLRAVAITPIRGEILASDGHPLADNIQVEQIDLSRTEAQLHPEVIGRLAALTGQTTAQIKQAVNSNQYSPYEPVPILSPAPAAQVLYINEHKSQFPGVTTTSATQRNYPQQEISGASQSEIGALPNYPAGSVLGYVSSISAAELKANASKGYQQGDQYGQSGLEAQYQSYLRGTPGEQQLEVDSSGNVVGTLKTTPAKAGDNVVTNINLPLQQYVDNALASQIKQDRQTPDAADGNQLPKAPDGAVVVMDPQGGQIFAMSSFPSFDPSIWTNGISTADYQALSDATDDVSALNNYAIQGTYTPGSTFKLNTATAALNSGLITAGYDFDDTNSFTVTPCTEGCTFHNDENDHGFGEINVTQAITVSSDDFFYNLGDMFYNARGTYGQTPIQDTAAQYSLGELTGIDLPGEVAGHVDSQAERVKLHKEAPGAFPYTTWYAADNVEMAFGQGATVVTPIEQAVAYSTFANGGTRYAPQVAAGIVSPSGKVIKKFAPEVTGHVSLPASTRNPMLQGFEGVIQQSDGTGYAAFAGNAFPTSELAGKTGTATTNEPEPTSWFVGWGPVANPEYVVVCVIDQGGYGAAASAPVVASIFNYLASHPVTSSPTIPPSQSTAQDNTAETVPTSTTTTTTTPGSSSSTTTTTQPGAAGSSTTTTTKPSATTTTSKG